MRRLYCYFVLLVALAVLVPGASAQSCAITSPTSSTIFLYPQAAQFTLSCSGVTGAYRAIWYIDYQRWATGFNSDQHQAIADWAEQWQGTPFAVQWQPGLSGDGEHTVYAVVQNSQEAILATTPAVTFTTNIQGLGTHTCIVTVPTASGYSNPPCPSSSSTNTWSGSGFLTINQGDANYTNRYNFVWLLDGEPISGSSPTDPFGHYTPCGENTATGTSSLAIFGGLNTWCWPNGSNLFQFGYPGTAQNSTPDPQIFGVPLPTSGSPSGNTLYFPPGNYPAGHWFYAGEPIVFSGAPPAPLGIGGIFTGVGQPSYWNQSTGVISAIPAPSGQTVTFDLNLNPESYGGSVGGNVFVRNLPYTDQITGQQPCDGEFEISAITTSSVSIIEPSNCNTSTMYSSLSSVYSNVELYINPYCTLYTDQNDIQVSSTFIPIQPPIAPPGGYQCGTPLTLTGSYSATASNTYGRFRSPYWSGGEPGSTNQNVFGNDFMNSSSPAAFNTELITLSNGSAGMEFQPTYAEFHGYAGKSGDTLCPSGSLNILNTDWSTTSISCATALASASFAAAGGVTGAISVNMSTGAVTYAETSSWSDPSHQTAIAYVTLNGNFCGTSHSAVCPAQTVMIENHGAAITFPSFSTCGVMATSFNVGLPANCQSFWPRSENVPNTTGPTWPWKLFQDSNVNSISIASYNGGSFGPLTTASTSSCPSSWSSDSYLGPLVSFLNQYNFSAEFEIADGLVSPNNDTGYGASVILGNARFNRQSCLQSLFSWMTTYPNNRFWQLGADDEVPGDIGSSGVPNPSPTIANAAAPMAAYLPSITSLGVSSGVMTAVVTNVANFSAWSQSAGTGNAFQLTGLVANSACNGWYLISGISGTGPYTITAPVPSYLSGCAASSIADSTGVMNLPSFTSGVPPNTGIIPSSPGQGCAALSNAYDCEKLAAGVSISVSGSTATVTWPVAHELSNGQVIRIWSGSTADLNTIAPITVTSSTQFTFVYPSGTGGTAPSCSPCTGTTDPNAYITVDPGFGASAWNSMWSVIDGVANAPCHGYSLNGLNYSSGNVAQIYNWMGNPANASCGGMLYMSTPPNNYSYPDTSNVQMSQYPLQTAATFRPWMRYPRAYLISDGFLPFVTQYCRSFGFNPACDKPASGANFGLQWSPELIVTQMMSAKAQGIAGFRHYKSGAGIQNYRYNDGLGWQGTVGAGGYGNTMDPYTVSRAWGGLARTNAALHSREDTELQPEADKPFLNVFTVIDAHTSATYGNETVLTCTSSYHCGAQALPLNPISGGSLILYLLDGYTLRVYTSTSLSALAGNPSSIAPPAGNCGSGDWGVSPITCQQSPGLTWWFVSLPANYSPLDSITFTPPAVLPAGASKFLIQVGYYPEDMRNDPVYDCTSSCTITIDHHDLNAWYRVIGADANGLPEQIGSPIEVVSQGLP